MTDVIRLLPDSVANQIAAGEVIQRPASVLKELVENAIDAGATEIAIQIVDAGRTLILVSDNGKGMSPTDARLAFERHATSKIRSADDLFTLSTMGFRGEALPSICAISQVELLTAVSSSEVGTKLVISGSKVERQETCNCNKGTTISVKNLFFNVPARRRFLKSDNVELANLLREFERLALVNNNVRFQIDTGSRKRDLRQGTFKQRIADLWKGSLNIELLPVEIKTDIVKISGYISRPEHARRRNQLQFLIVNGRNMRHPRFSRAIINCYDKLIAQDTQPNFFLKFEVDPATIDVNIHPTKDEIKFENEQEIWSLLTSAVRAALGKFSAVPDIDFETGAIEIRPLSPGEIPPSPSTTIQSDYNPFATRSTDYVPHATNVRNWDSLYVGFMNQAKEDEDERVSAVGLQFYGKQEEECLPPMCIQVDKKYIVASAGSGVMVIDQYRAHVKILFEDLMHHSSDNPIPLQGVMFGEVLHLDETQQTILEGIRDELVSLGITLLPQAGTWVISTLPPMLNNRDGKETILGIIDNLNADSNSSGVEVPGSEILRKKVALAAARSSAIERGRVLSSSEMEHIVSRLLRLETPSVGPDGKAVMYVLTGEKINSFFR